MHSTEDAQDTCATHPRHFESFVRGPRRLWEELRWRRREPHEPLPNQDNPLRQDRNPQHVKIDYHMDMLFTSHERNLATPLLVFQSVYSALRRVAQF